jgi:hypothetical protein
LFRRMARYDAWQTPTLTLRKRLSLIGIDELVRQGTELAPARRTSDVGRSPSGCEQVPRPSSWSAFGSTMTFTPRSWR